LTGIRERTWQPEMERRTQTKKRCEGRKKGRMQGSFMAIGSKGAFRKKITGKELRGRQQKKGAKILKRGEKEKKETC